MKDAYSFDRDEAGLDATYRKMYEAYTRIFARCGLDLERSKPTQERSAVTRPTNSWCSPRVGEAAVVYCRQCDFAANVEKAASVPTAGPEAPGPGAELERWRRPACAPSRN